MAAPGAAELEVRRLREELAAKDTELDELRDRMIGMLDRHQEQYVELRSWLEDSSKQLRELIDRVARQVDELTGRQVQERAEREEVEERLGRTLADVAAQIELLRGVYRQTSAALPAIGLVPYHHHANFDDWRLGDLVLFFRHLSGQLTRLRASVGDKLDREGVHAGLAVAAHILPGLHHRDPFFPVDAIMDELPPAERGRSLRAVASSIAAVVQLEERDFGGR